MRILLRSGEGWDHPAAPVSDDWKDVAAGPAKQSKVPHYDPADDAHVGTIGISGFDTPAEQLKDLGRLIGNLGRRVKAVFVTLGPR